MLTSLFLLTNVAALGLGQSPPAGPERAWPLVEAIIPDSLVSDASHAEGPAMLRDPAAIVTDLSMNPRTAAWRAARRADDVPAWAHNPRKIPLPPALWTGIAGLAAVAGIGLVRRRRM